MKFVHFRLVFVASKAKTLRSGICNFIDTQRFTICFSDFLPFPTKFAAKLVIWTLRCENVAICDCDSLGRKGFEESIWFSFI